MNRTELQLALERRCPDELAAFYAKFGGGQQPIESFVQAFMQHPEWEARLCHLLGFPTEDERKTDAALRSAEAALTSATAAKMSAAVAILSAAIAFCSLLATLYF